MPWNVPVSGIQKGDFCGRAITTFPGHTDLADALPLAEQGRKERSSRALLEAPHPRGWFSFLMNQQIPSETPTPLTRGG